MITYNDLYEFLRKERYSDQIQTFPKNFVEDVAAYFDEKRQIASKDGDMFSDAIIKTKKQFENALGIFKELMLRRRRKLLNLAFVAAETGITKRDFENMLDFEKDMFEKIVKSIEDSEKHLSSFLTGKKQTGEVKTTRLLIFKQDTEEFMGLSGEMLGPFKKGQIANLPREISDILLESGKAEKVGGE